MSDEVVVTEMEKRHLAEVAQIKAEKDAETEALIEFVTEAVVARLENKSTKKKEK